MVTRSPRRAVEQEPVVAAWAAIAFGDLHVKATTLERCIIVLDRVRELALKHEAMVVCTGDFWDLRGVLSVRQLHRIQDALESHRSDSIEWVMIPGNHDQVTRDGQIHGLRVFESYQNIRVVTQAVLDDHRKVAFIPWREDQDEQSALFASVPAGYTIFGHGEYRGATSNSRHKAEGRFSAKDVAGARAVYLGHYHKRQQLDEKVWYISSPYEQNMGERAMPHGVAIVRSIDPTKPEFVDFTDLPRHWRFTWPDDAKKFGKPAAHDFVELRARKEDLTLPEFAHARAKLKAVDIRPVLLGASTKKDVPSFALSLSEAVDRYADEAGTPELDKDVLRETGHTLLGEVEDKHTIIPKGKVVHLRKLEVEGFGPLRGRAVLSLDRKGTVLFRGPMGSGKTALAADAITWCLYGVTAPRKPGTAGSSLKADDVINDTCSEARVSVTLRLDDRKATYRVTRTKMRGKGAKIEVFRKKEPWGAAGISDSQDLIHHLVGLDYDLWRSCVSLGQGEVSNFVTDAQKRRTELLERVFRLQACPPAQTLARKRRKETSDKAEPRRRQVIALNAKIETIESIDHTEQLRLWEADRQRGIAEQQEIVTGVDAEVVSFDAALTHDQAWTDRAAHLRSEIERMRTGFQKSDKRPQMGKLHSQIGAAEAEVGIAQRELSKLTASLQKGQRIGTCETCGQMLPAEVREQHLLNIEEQIRARQSEISTLEVRASNLKTELGQIAKTHALPEEQVAASGLPVQLQDAEKAVAAIVQIKAKRTAALRVRQNAESVIERWKAAINPWESEHQKQQKQLTGLREDVASQAQEIHALDTQTAMYKFWEDGFGPNGLPVLVLRTAIYELETYANAFLARVLNGRLNVELEMLGDELEVKYREYEDGVMKIRDYLQLSGGQRRCVQLAFTPFAISEMVFARTGIRVPFLVIDELTSHVDPETKPMLCQALRDLDRETVFVIDHDVTVQGEFDEVYDVTRGGQIKRGEDG